MPRKIAGKDLRTYASVLRYVQVVVCAAPIGIKLLQPNAGYIIPPLGTINLLGIGFSVVLMGICSFVPWSMNKSRYAIATLSLSVLAGLIALITYSFYAQSFVREISVPSQNRSILVSVGTERSEFANRVYPGRSDEDMLKDQGIQEEDVARLWTRSSILHARLRLFCSYLATLISLNLCFGALGRIAQLRAEHDR